MVPAGDVRAADMLENDRADKAAEMGRLHLSEPAIDARRALFGARRHRYSTMLDLQKYIVAIPRNVVNHDGLGSTALDAITWDKGGILKDYVIHVGINIDFSSLPGPAKLLDKLLGPQ